MKKVLNDDGKVAVLYSPGYGSEWYSWNKEYPEMVFHTKMVRAVLECEKLDLDEEDRVKKLKRLAETLFPGAYLGGISDLKVEWIYRGTTFRIVEHDGYESIEYIGDDCLCA